MDRRVKERLIGASILVALVVLVVPELLSGPKPSAPTMMKLPASAPEPTRIVTLDLATSKAPASTENDTAATQGSAAPPAAEASGNAAPNASAGTASAGTASAGTASAGTSSPAAAPVESPAPSPISSRSAWAVQLGSFASRANADNLSRQLKGQGYSVYVLPGGSGAQVRYRVRIGPLADRGAAERMAGKLKSIGHVSSLVGPAG